MIRALIGLSRKPEVGLLEFRQRLGPVLEEVLAVYCEAAQASGFRVHFALQVEETRRFQAIWGGSSPFDLIVEVFWADGPACREGTASPRALELARKLEACNALIDLERSTLTYLQDPVQ